MRGFCLSLSGFPSFASFSPSASRLSYSFSAAKVKCRSLPVRSEGAQGYSASTPSVPCSPPPGRPSPPFTSLSGNNASCLRAASHRRQGLWRNVFIPYCLRAAAFQVTTAPRLLPTLMQNGAPLPYFFFLSFCQQQRASLRTVGGQE